MDRKQTIFILKDMILEHDSKARYGVINNDEFYAKEHQTIADALRFALLELEKDIGDADE